ncbi:lytic transglycosylase domain-containing protein [Horticoccus luteus]|uniref:Lytic transglycosylase domain-containing protein n=1 Tax=Horticoccus luteus TaxID=2862869 RepID=A0A8F9XJV7_9BACT|nr:lytic transglycosylase domain-containing protein [Horticoccus luteus]QYM79073.1 lytic transglycosylase domain-containing protein [Horticoccus luteus]
MRLAPSLFPLVLLVVPLAFAEPQPEPAPASTAPASSSSTPAAPPAETSAQNPVTPDDLYDIGQSLFEQFAPADIKEQYAFPSKAQWDGFVGNLEHALESDSLADLARYEPQTLHALAALRTSPDGPEYTDWLKERLDYIQAAKELSDTATTPAAPSPSAEPAPTPPTATAPASPTTPPAPSSTAATQPAVPHYDLWLKRVQNRPAPADAEELMPRLRAAFLAEGVPPELAWLAEVESTLNPAACSPAGARGLFQMMPATAKHLGLSTFLPDERTDPEKSAHAAARYLKTLHARFGTWPLALAAYNAGEGRVARALAAQHGDTFAQIAAQLPAETRMYVPKVCALVAIRTGTPANELPPPRA